MWHRGTTQEEEVAWRGIHRKESNTEGGQHRPREGVSIKGGI